MGAEWTFFKSDHFIYLCLFIYCQAFIEAEVEEKWICRPAFETNHRRSVKKYCCCLMHSGSGQVWNSELVDKYVCTRWVRMAYIQYSNSGNWKQEAAKSIYFWKCSPSLVKWTKMGFAKVFLATVLDWDWWFVLALWFWKLVWLFSYVDMFIKRLKNKKIKHHFPTSMLFLSRYFTQKNI